MGAPEPSVYTARMLRYSLLRPLRCALILALTALPLAGCGQTGRLFMRQPAVTFPPQSGAPRLHFRDLSLPACLYQAEMAQLAGLRPGAIAQVAPDAITHLPVTVAVTDADGFQQDAPSPCALQPPMLLEGAELPEPAPAATTQAAP